ncbi:MULTISPECIES: DUF3301 domain-containing protein [Alteromonadaceae]|uniref:DUF3301 domain-containing protein n=1 Tax=Alteromonadaceae TaxID=72275 RepID=UPI001C081391|nr:MULTISPECIES: DUF3301 domain-containing protein [Aliiglaciecola]MBU2879637.1 DUF3301 domain-containing protein [Aliiglaciecola lipolytica]MDO6710084.1 DUF3301 domain-containing protein [Aliiglaciecola sp. 2_MG-2023]MDO6751232.1 DUF3301 domain-containing protein [Aliiglaciecola sp. 1_MG-2023]
MNFNLTDILVLFIIAAIAFQFWRIRGISEQAKVYLEKYCEINGLQLISIARSKTKVIFHKAKLDWYTEFSFEFSSTGEERYLGLLKMRGVSVDDVNVPAYRIS